MRPRLSVVVTTLGRETLIRTLESLIASDLKGDLEILVVGEVKDDTVASELERLISLRPGVKHLPASFEHGDMCSKRNLGFAESAADIVAFVDDDVVVADDWPSRVLEAFDREGVGMVSGPSLVPEDLSLVARLAGSALSSMAAGYVAARYRDSGEIREVKWSRVIGCNMAFRREALKGADGFDARFGPGDDMLVAHKVAKLGYRILFHPRASLYHYPRSSLWGFARQMYGYGATRIRLIREGLDVEILTMAPAAWVLSLVVLSVAVPFCVWAAWLLLLNLALYACCALVITIMKCLETRKSVDLMVFFIIPLMHLAYGIAEWMEVFLPNRDMGEG